MEQKQTVPEYQLSTQRQNLSGERNRVYFQNVKWTFLLFPFKLRLCWRVPQFSPWTSEIEEFKWGFKVIFSLPELTNLIYLNLIVIWILYRKKLQDPCWINFWLQCYLHILMMVNNRMSGKIILLFKL